MLNIYPSLRMPIVLRHSVREENTNITLLMSVRTITESSRCSLAISTRWWTIYRSYTLGGNPLPSMAPESDQLAASGSPCLRFPTVVRLWHNGGPFCCWIRPRAARRASRFSVRRAFSAVREVVLLVLVAPLARLHALEQRVFDLEARSSYRVRSRLCWGIYW